MGGFVKAPGSGGREEEDVAGRRSSGGSQARRLRLPMSRTLRALALALATFVAVAAVPAAASAATEPFKSVLGGKGLECSTTAGYAGGVRFCEGNGTTTRIPSWDGVPLDVDVTLPATGAGPFPTIVMLHGFGSEKKDFESKNPEGEGAEPSANEIYDYNNDYFAQHGYAVVNYTARGFGKSCGLSESTTAACAAHGFIHLVDQRYEARDTQYLLGLLAEEGVAEAGKLGVTGISYGGGQSIELAYLKNRIRCAGPADTGEVGGVYQGKGVNPCAGEPENAFVPWTTPNGATKLEINAAYARWPWSDIANSLNPNGRFLEYDPATYGQDGASGTDSPVGVPLTSYQQALYADGELAQGYYEPLTGSPEWNLTKSLLLFRHPEPENPEDQEVINDLSAYHGGFAVPTESAPAPLLMESGWNDDLFPPEETLRVYNSVREKYGAGADVYLQFGDVGHSRGSDTVQDDQYFNAQGAAFFDEKLKEETGVTVETAKTKENVAAPLPGSVKAFTTTCPADGLEDFNAGVGGGDAPYEGSSWAALQKGDLTISSSTAQTVTNPPSAENQAIGGEFDPILQQERMTPKVAALGGEGTTGACKEIFAIEPKGTASYLLGLGEEVTLMGLPTISAEISVTGTKDENGEIDARLWDVNPMTEKERLVSRGDFRLEEPQTKNIVFQLHGNGYTIKADEALKLELTTSEFPYYYDSQTAEYSVSVKSLHAYLPTYSGPGLQVVAPVPVSSLPQPETPLKKAAKEEPKSEKPAAKAEEKLTKIEPPVLTTETPVHGVESGPAPRQCLSRRTVTIKLPKYKNGKITTAVLTLKGKTVKTVRGGSLKSVSYKFKSAVRGETTLKLKLTVKQAKSGKTTTITKKLSRGYDFCASK